MSDFKGKMHQILFRKGSEGRGKEGGRERKGKKKGGHGKGREGTEEDTPEFYLASADPLGYNLKWKFLAILASSPQHSDCDCAHGRSDTNLSFIHCLFAYVQQWAHASWASIISPDHQGAKFMTRDACAWKYTAEGYVGVDGEGIAPQKSSGVTPKIFEKLYTTVCVGLVDWNKGDWLIYIFIRHKRQNNKEVGPNIMQIYAF